jgi:hypothetical protein
MANVTIDGIEYAPVGSKPTGDVVMVRSRDAGVFYGSLVSKVDAEVNLTNARRVYYWDGAATLSELATRGTSKPENCKFPAPTAGIHAVLGVCEIIPVTAEAKKSLDSVTVWSA